MKKFISISLAALVLFSSAGFSLSIHYCGESMRDVAVNKKAKPCCEGMEMPSGCCHDEHITPASNDFMLTAISNSSPVAQPFLCAVSFPLINFSSQYKFEGRHQRGLIDDFRLRAQADIVLRAHAFLI